MTTTRATSILLFLVVYLAISCDAFVTPSSRRLSTTNHRLLPAEPPSAAESTTPESTTEDKEDDPFANMDAATAAKLRRASELRQQEVFMKKSLGKHQCTNCDWEYDQSIGDSNMIGGQVPAGTTFAQLPANWRCPVCRASKDSFQELTEEIPGFAVNQGYGFGSNAWSAGQKNLAIFGGLGLFFLLFLSGYALN